MGYDVVCVGSATVDTYFSITKSFKEVSTGDKVLTTKHTQNSGGGAINSARVLATLGHKVAILSKIGDDHNAQLIRKELKNAKIQLLTKKTSHMPTDSSSIISSTTDKDRVIFVNKGASSNLTEKDIPKRILQKAKWIYLATLIGKSKKVLHHIATHKKKAKLLFNPSLYLASLGIQKLQPYLNAANVIILNKKEAIALVKNSALSAKKMLSIITKQGSEIVIITNGNKTLWARDTNHIYSIQPPKIKAIHTAGAGDAFNSGFLSGQLHKRTVEYSLLLGLSCAASMVCCVGTNNKLLTFTEAEKMIQKCKMKVRKYNVR